MALLDDVSADINTALNQTWDTRTGYVVPETDDVKLVGGAVELDATFLYSDLADSTKLAMYDRRVAARVIRAFLSSSTRLIRAHGGHIRSFDGDRVMGIFRSDTKNTSAVKCALKINWVFSNYLVPRFTAKYSLASNGLVLSQSTGVDTSMALTVRSGIRNNNDLVWVGRAPNVAAKLCSLRDGNYRSWITGEVYDGMHDSAKFSIGEGKPMWEERSWTAGPVKRIFRSGWTWKPD